MDQCHRAGKCHDGSGQTPALPVPGHGANPPASPRSKSGDTPALPVPGHGANPPASPRGESGHTPARPVPGHGANPPAGPRGESGDTLALVVIWPALITVILLMLVHAFIVTNARAEAEVAASQGLRSAWRAAAGKDFLADPNNSNSTYTGDAPHPDVLEMVDAAEDAVARAAATRQGWRWWTPGAATVHSNWCLGFNGGRPSHGEAGWVQVVVSGEVFGPLAALWPDRWDRIHAAAQGPAVLTASDSRTTVPDPAELTEC